MENFCDEKMRTAFLINFGFDVSPFIDIISNYSPTTGDLIVLLRPQMEENSARAEKAVSEVKVILSTLKSANRSIDLEQFLVNASDPLTAASEIAEKLVKSRNTYNRIVADISGGIRPIMVAIMLCFIAKPNLFTEVTMLAEPTRQRVFVPLAEILEIKALGLARTLVQVSKGGNLKSVGTRLGVTESSVSRYINRLKTLGMVYHKRGKLSLTPLGEKLLGLAIHME